MAGRRAFLSTGPQPEQGFLPPIIRLARNEASRELIVPVGLVTDLYDARANWDAIVGRSMDATTTAIVHGRLVMPLGTRLHGPGLTSQAPLPNSGRCTLQSTTCCARAWSSPPMSQPFLPLRNRPPPTDDSHKRKRGETAITTMANAAADSSVREPPQATTVALEQEAKGLHQPEQHTTLGQRMDPCFTAQLHIAHPHFPLSRSTLSTTTRFRLSRARRRCPTLCCPPPGASENACARSQGTCDIRCLGLRSGAAGRLALA